MKIFAYDSKDLELRFDYETSGGDPVELEILIKETERLKKLLPNFNGFETFLYPPRTGYNGLHVICKAYHFDGKHDEAEKDMEQLRRGGFQEIEVESMRRQRWT